MTLKKLNLNSMHCWNCIRTEVAYMTFARQLISTSNTTTFLRNSLSSIANKRFRHTSQLLHCAARLNIHYVKLKTHNKHRKHTPTIADNSCLRPLHQVVWCHFHNLIHFVYCASVCRTSSQLHCKETPASSWSSSDYAAEG